MAVGTMYHKWNHLPLFSFLLYPPNNSKVKNNNKKAAIIMATPISPSLKLIKGIIYQI